MTFFRERCFVGLSAALWVSFLVIDLYGGSNSTPVKFASVCLCAAVAWTARRTRDGLLVSAALSLTVCADVFLLLLDRNDADRLRGLALFIAVQLLYAYRLCCLRSGAPSLPGLFARLGGVLAAGLLYLDRGNPVPALAALYFLNLCVNCAEAFSLRAAGPVSRFGWGLLLFLGCDLCVGGWNLGLLTGFTRVGMWLFYLPSQVLIVLSQQTEGEAS